MTAILRIAAAAAAILIGANVAVAQQDEVVSETAAAAAGAGTSADPSASQLVSSPQISLGTISPANSFASASVGTGGVGLRNRGAGAISVSGVTRPVRAAFLYWAVITNGAPPAAVRTVRLQRQFPLPLSATVALTGTLVGSGPSPCWGGTGIFVFKAAVPLAIVTGNGLYTVRLLTGASGRIRGEDPWLTSLIFPLFEGASLVVVGTGGYRVALYDRGLAGRTFINTPVGQTYTLALPVAAPGNAAFFGHVGADGQAGISLSATLAISGDITRANATRISGPGSIANDSNWNGTIAGPLPQLWDTTTRDVTRVVARGMTALPIADFVTASGTTDCLTPVANVMALR